MDRPIPATIEHEIYPQQLPQALTVLVRSTFDYPEPFFGHTAGDPNATAAINADDLDSGHPGPEHRHW